MKILVTGASGLLGSAVAARFQREGHTVIGVCHRHSISIPGVQVVPVDLSSTDDVSALISTTRPQWVIHCAAMTKVDACEDEPDAAERLNAGAPRALARALADSGSWMLHVSTDAVFDGIKGRYTEADQPRPLNAYARSKLAGERAVLGELPLRSVVVRTTIYGWNPQPKPSVAEWFLRMFRAGAPFVGFRDVVFTPILVDDLARVFLELVSRSEPGLYHVASQDACSKYEFGIRIARAFELDPSLLVPGLLADVPLRARRPRDTSLLTDKVMRSVGVQMPTVDEGIQRFRASEPVGPRR